MWVGRDSILPPPPHLPPSRHQVFLDLHLNIKNEIMNKIQSRKGLDSVLIKFNVTSLGRGALYILPVYPIPLFFQTKKRRVRTRQELPHPSQ